MRSLFPLALGLVACGFEPGSLARTDAGGGGADGADAAVDAPAIDAQMLDAFVDVDSDGDGVLDGADNCPTVSNADQRNHDGDPFGDACDRCPHLASTTDPDGDEDGIGDDCDPRPQAAGDTLALWDGFYDNTGFATWGIGAGTWSVSGGMLRQTSTTADFAYVYPILMTARHAISAGVRVDTVGTPNTSVSPNVFPGFAVGGGTTGTTQGYYCSLSTSNGNRVIAFAWWPGNNGVSNNTTWSGTFASGSLYTITERVVGGSHDCRVSQANTTSQLTQTHGTTAGYPVLATSRIAGSYDYVFIVAVGSP